MSNDAIKHLASAPTLARGSDQGRTAGDAEARERTIVGTVSLVVTLAILLIVTVSGWVALYRWYGLFEHRDHTHFAFEKIPGGFDSPVLRQTALVFLCLTAAYVIAVHTLRSAGSLPLPAKVLVAALVGGPAIACVLLYPVGALDVFNYMIEIKLAFHYDQNPYLVTFAAYRDDPFALPAFLVDITLFYGPAWLLSMWIPAAIAGLHDVVQTLIALKVFNLVLLTVTGLLIARARSASLPGWTAAALFLANPLVLFEGVANAHNDVLLTVFLVAAMVALRHRSPLAGPLLALSALVKLYPVALAPIFVVVALKDRWGWRRIALALGLTAIVVAATCAPYWGDGKLVDGMRSGLEESQIMDHVSPFSLAQQYAQQREAEGRPDATFFLGRPSAEVLPESTSATLRTAFTAAFAIGTLLLAAAVWRGHPPELAAAETLLLLLLLMTNLYGWYLIPVFALLALRPDRLGSAYIMVATALGLVYYPMFVYAHFNTTWSRFEVHQFLALFLTLPIVLYLLARLALRRRPGGDVFDVPAPAGG